MADNTTLSDFLAELGVDINNMQEFLLKLNQMFTTTNDVVTFTQTSIGADGNTVVTNLPVISHASLVNKVKNIDDKFNTLLEANGNRVHVTSNDTTKSFELLDISSVIKDLNSVKTKVVTAPLNFNTKTNYFFESFLNPLVYIDLDVSEITTSTEIDKFEITRIIIPNSAAAVFDDKYKGASNLDYTDVIDDFKTIGYTIDVNEQSLPPASSKNFGTFTVSGAILSGSTEGQTSVTLSTTNYLQYVEGITGQTTIDKTLAPNDILITSNNSEYKIISVTPSPSSLVILTRIFGNQVITVGSTLSIKPDFVI